MMQKKHESDLTRKEKWQLEREKVASMSWKKRIEYFFTYYKWVTCGGSGSDCTRSVWGKLVQELAERRAIKCGNRQFFCAEYRKFKSRFAESTENQRQESDYHDRYFRLYQRRKSDDI